MIVLRGGFFYSSQQELKNFISWKNGIIFVNYLLRINVGRLCPRLRARKGKEP